MTDKKLGNVRHLPVAWSEKAELTKKIAQAEKRLLSYQEEAAKYQAEAAEINQRIAHLEKRQAALTRFYKRGPHSKKKSGRPGFWKSPHGCTFVLEVERIKQERKCKTATAIRVAKKELIQWGQQLSKTYSKDNPAIARAARLVRLTDDAALQSRYQEARRYWLFMVDPEAYQREEEALQRNFERALQALQDAAPKKNPYDFS